MKLKELFPDAGHCSFPKSPSGREDWLVYHAMLGPRDPRRYVCLQKFAWNADGTPNFGTPRKTDISNPE
jgi:GH43 family beta-xylosidase